MTKLKIECTYLEHNVFYFKLDNDLIKILSNGH